MYNTFSAEYDRFVNWENRLAYEMPFLEKILSQAGRDGGKPTVLDAACGTGMHAIALAKRGYSVSGADLYPEMIDQAKKNAEEVGMQVRFESVGFGSLSLAFGNSNMDAVLCLGNSLPHVASKADLQAALQDFTAVLRPGGSLLLQNRNFDKVMQQKQRWMDPQSHTDGSREWIFLRFYDFDPDGHIQFHIVTLQRTGAGVWEQTVRSTTLLPLLHLEMEKELARAGFENIQLFGSMDGSSFDAEQSDNCIIQATCN